MVRKSSSPPDLLKKPWRRLTGAKYFQDRNARLDRIETHRIDRADSARGLNPEIGQESRSFARNFSIEAKNTIQEEEASILPCIFREYALSFVYPKMSSVRAKLLEREKRFREFRAREDRDRGSIEQ